MAFNFGASSTPAPGPATAEGAFSFGGSSTTAAGQPTATAAAPAPVAFGGTPAAGTAPQTPAAPAASGFSLGGAAAPTTNTPAAPTFGASTPANAPAPSGAPAPTPSFAFGSTAANTPAPGTFGVPAPAPTTATPALAGAPTAFSFGGAATPAPGAGTFSLTGSTPAAPTNTLAAAPAAPRGLEVPDFHTVFPNEAIYSDLRRLLSKSSKATEEGREAASEIVDRLRCHGAKAVGQLLSAPKPLQYNKAPDFNLRNQLVANPTVVLSENREADLLPSMLQEVFLIADNLHISEKEALVLYAEANKHSTRVMLEEKLVQSIIDKSLSDDEKDGPLPPVVFGTDVVKAAKELYFFERQRCLQSILILAQSRIEGPQMPWGDLIIQATDSLLQNKLIDNLIGLIREWTTIIGGIEQSLTRDQSQSFSAFTKEKKKKQHFDMVHLTFAKQERQTATEALFYLSYQTQFEAQEVGNLVDLVRDLSNGVNGDKGLPVLDPFRDVPSSFEDPPQGEHMWAPYSNSLSPQKERKHLEWERLLVKKTFQTSLPELLRCVSALVMTVISTMDTKHILLDRTTHLGNSFGQGNKLCPPGESSTKGPEPIDSRLSLEGVGNSGWRRTDIVGLFCGAYAMLRSTNPRLLSSPRGAGSSPSKVFARTVGDLLTAPMALKSITFARLCLLPALQRPSLQPESLCDSSEFMLSVLSEFVSSFMDSLSNSGNLPGSRKTWKKEQEEGLALEREQQKQQREFRIWSGNFQQGAEDKPVPTSLNLMDRPDCMDDIITLAVAVASSGPEFAVKFWSSTQEIDENGTASLVPSPSKTLKKLKSIIAEDDSLTAFYYAFLAALSTASCNCADAVNSILASPTESRWDWDQVLETLRWYYRQFNTTSSATNMSSGAQSASNYYRNVSVANASQEAAKALASKSQPLPLGQTNTFWILSLLGLLEKATKSPTARLAILSKQLPIRAENSGTVLGNDTTLNILFALLTAPITPEIRGAITTTISSLLSMKDMEAATEDDRAKMREFCTQAWELVESCQILPIMLLDQYPSMAGEVNRTSSGLQFPASSTSLAGNGTSNNSMIPIDKSYAILFEMEHVESHSGIYPSTEGFLRLLDSLFSCGCPTTLGHQWRFRTGCTPYIEYVVHFVLPRATGSVDSIGKLPFRSKADESRLVSLALQVIESVLIRYSFTIHADQPGLSLLPNQERRSPTFTEAFHRLGHKMLAEKVVDTSASSCTGNGRADFENKTIPHGQLGQMGPGFPGIQNQGLSQPFRGQAASSIPTSKSPGFVVLANILSASDGEILKGLASILADSTAVSSTAGIESSKLSEAYALFKDLPPTTSSAKHAGKNDTISSSTRENQLEGLRPYSQQSSCYSASVSWQERSVMHALQILCAAAAREEKFYVAVNSSLQPLRIVPILHFDKRPGLASQITGQNVHLSRLCDLVLAPANLVMSVVDYVGHDCSKEDHDVSVAMSGLSLMHFIDQMLPGNKSIEAILGRVGNRRLSVAFARRLSASFERCDSTPDLQTLSLILNWILSDLREGKKAGLAHALFAVQENDDQKTGKAPGGAKDCFGAMLNMLDDNSFILDMKTSGFAASCFEIVARFCDLKYVNESASLRQVVYAMERLRASYFWKTKLFFFLGNTSFGEPTKLQSAVSSGNSNLIHSLAWFLKGVASELHMLSGFSPPVLAPNNLVGYIAPRGDRDALLAFLFGSNEGISNVVRDLPVERLSLDDSARMPSQEAIRAAMKELPGSAEVARGYQMVDEVLLLKRVSERYGKDQVDEFKRWSRSWNLAVKLDCAASHLSDVLRSLVGASLSSYDSERSIPSETLAVLLTSVLGRLVEGSGAPTATSNLSFIALLLSQQLVYPGSGNGIPVADLRRIRDLLARAVVASGKHSGGQEARRAQERTAILSASLVEVMSWPNVPDDETEIDHNLFLGVAHTLAKLCAVVERGQSAAVVPTEAALIARKTLSILVQMWDQEIQTPNESLAFTFLSQASDGESKTNAQVLLEGLSSLDEGIVTLIEELLHVPFVGDALLQRGLMQSLSHAADKYIQQEHILQQSWSQDANGRKVAIGFPSCLKKHLELFRVLLSTSQYLSQLHVSELPTNFANILGKYIQVIERTFSNFSSYGEELRLLLQCVAQLSTLLTDTKSLMHSSMNPCQPLASARSTLRGSPIEKSILHLSLHLAENPVPKDWLAELPHSLSRSDKSTMSNVVPVSVALGCSWWDQFHSVKRKGLACNFEEWTEDMFKHAILGADTLKVGLSVLSSLQQTKIEVELCFVRGLFLLSKAAQSVENQVELLYMSSQTVFMDTDGLPTGKKRDYLRRFGRLLSSCLERLLFLLVSRVKLFILEPENRLTGSVAKYCKAIADTLDHTELETQGIPCSMGKDEENRGKLLATALREHTLTDTPMA